MQAFSSVEIEDSKRMQRLSEAALRDSAGEQISSPSTLDLKKVS